MCVASCYKNHLYVQQEKVDVNFLASSHIQTPDPRLAHPPEGSRLLISWNFPRCLFGEQLTFLVTVRFWDNTEKILVKTIHHRRGSTAFDFSNPGTCLSSQILTYKIDVFTEEGTLIETWKHHFWVELIDLHPDKTVSAQRSQCSVSSHPKHGSVIETP